VTFVGGTLWTDMNKEDPTTMFSITRAMNDYRLVENSSEVVTYKVFMDKDKPVGMTDQEWLALPYESRVVASFKTRPAKFSPQNSVDDHKQMLFAIAKAVEDTPDDRKIVVVGHHAPSKLSTKPRYENDTIVNGAYSSDLSEFILNYPKIKLWTMGHTHHAHRYYVGETLVACNPRGYIGYEKCANEFVLRYIDLNNMPEKFDGVDWNWEL
jgi:DNA repair exonuclease SbcCD nuclease subunit